MPRDAPLFSLDRLEATLPFHDAAEAWFWFMDCHAARQDGARIQRGAGRVPRPCEPIDVIRVVDRLYRQRRLIRDHICVLAHYGRRSMAPEPSRRREQRAHGLWMEALARMEPVMRRKGIVA